MNEIRDEESQAFDWAEAKGVADVAKDVPLLLDSLRVLPTTIIGYSVVQSPEKPTDWTMPNCTKSRRLGKTPKNKSFMVLAFIDEPSGIT